MAFLWIEMLWALPLVPALVIAYLLAQRRRQRYALRYASLTLAKDTLFTLLAFTGVGTPGQKKVAFDPAGRTDFPAGMKVAADRAPRIAEDYSSVFFGIKEAKKPPPRPTPMAGPAR